MTTSRTLKIFPGLLALLTLAACGGSSEKKVCNASNCCGGSDACPATQVVFANGLDGMVAGFPVNPVTGALSAPTTTPGPAMSLGMAAMNSQFLYVSELQPNLGDPSTISAWSINLGNGTLTTVPQSPFSLGPLTVAGGLAVDHSAQVLYVGDAGKIDALKADATGALSPLPNSPFPSGINIFLTIDPQDHFLFAADDRPPGGVVAFTIDSTGAPTPVTGSPFPVIPNSNDNTQPTEIVVDSSGKFVYTGLLLTNQIAALAIAPSTGVLSPVPGSPFATGNSPFHLATVNNFLYVSNIFDHALSGYSIDPTTGVLKPLSGSPFAIPAGPLTSDPTGQFLYTTIRGSMLAFSINASTGALTPIGSPIPYVGASVLTFVQ
ncbi:MAG TPA: beta-propeller fold lactonase family protein [Candidatus Sulfotelmatobacter sp.]|nr:beta-propeller fold lactonase family protein [Candidatus Sulfotelmatobacter sp.]